MITPMTIHLLITPKAFRSFGYLGFIHSVLLPFWLGLSKNTDVENNFKRHPYCSGFSYLVLLLSPLLRATKEQTY